MTLWLALPPLAALMSGCRSCGDRGLNAGAPSPEGEPPPAASPSGPASTPSPPAIAARPGRPATLGEMLGVNEGVSLPQALIRNGSIPREREPALLAVDAAAVKAVGGRVVRANTATYPWLHWQGFERDQRSFARADDWVRAVTAAGLTPLVMLGPWPGNHTAAHTDLYPPKDMDGYLAYVRAVVERYDGDGVDDMPGLTAPVKHWEVDNEPDLHNTVAPKGGGASVPPEQFQTPAEYGALLVATATAIRQTDPDALVLSAGFFRPHTPQGRAWISAMLAHPGTREAFDILSLHCYSDKDELGAAERTVETWRALLPEKGLWVTETSVASTGKAPHISEAWQGKMVAGIYGAMLAGGADRVFWHTLADPPASTPTGHLSGFSSHSLFQSAGSPGGPDGGGLREKPAATVYRNLHRLAGASRADSLVDLTVDGGRLLQTDRGWLLYWGEIIPPEGATHSTDLLNGVERPVGARVSAPAWLEARPIAPG